MSPFPRKHKFNAKPLEYKGHKYPSTAEAERAMELDQLKADGEVAWWLGQVTFLLDGDYKYRVDFLVMKSRPITTLYASLEDVALAPAPRPVYEIHAEDVKGAETPMFKETRRLWAKYGPCPLHIIKGGKVEILEGGGK